MILLNNRQKVQLYEDLMRRYHCQLVLSLRTLKTLLTLLCLNIYERHFQEYSYLGLLQTVHFAVDSAGGWFVLI